MKYKKIIRLVSLSALFAFISVQTAFADPATTKVVCNDGKKVTATRSGSTFTLKDYQKACKGHGGYTAPKAASTSTGSADPGCATSILPSSLCDNGTDVEDNGVWKLLLIAINLLTAGIGVVAVGGIVYASILYASAEDKNEQVSQAKQIITNVVIGLVMFILMWSLLNFIIPGGVFS